MNRMRLDDAFTCSPTESALAAKEPGSSTKMSYKMNPLCTCQRRSIHLARLPAAAAGQHDNSADRQTPEHSRVDVGIHRREDLNHLRGNGDGEPSSEQRGPPLCVFLCKLACEVLLPKDLTMTELADSPATLQRRIALSSTNLMI